MKSKKSAKTISLMIAGVLSLSVLFFAEDVMDVYGAETQDTKVTKVESDSKTTGSGTDENMAADVKVTATSKTNNIIGEVFANMFNDGDDETAKAKREASIEEYPFEFHDLDYYGDSPRVRILEGGDEEGSNYLVYRDSYLLIDEKDSGNYSVEFSKDGREAYVSPAIPASELEDKMGVVFLADYVGDDVILVFDGEPAYDADTMTVPVLTTEDITVNMLFSDVKLSIEQPQAKPQTKKQTKSNGKGISLKAVPSGGYIENISGPNWSGTVNDFSVDKFEIFPTIDITNENVSVDVAISTTIDFDITSTGSGVDTVRIANLDVPMHVFDLQYEYHLIVKFYDEIPVHVKGRMKTEFEYNISSSTSLRVTKFRTPVTLEAVELRDPNQEVRFYIGSELRAYGSISVIPRPLPGDDIIPLVEFMSHDVVGGNDFVARHEKNQHTEGDRSKEMIHTCAREGREGCLEVLVTEKYKYQLRVRLQTFHGAIVSYSADEKDVDNYHEHKSLTYKTDFLRGPCPRKYYKLPVHVTSKDGKPLQGFNVSINKPIYIPDDASEYAEDITDESGMAAIYLPYKEEYKYTAVADGQVHGFDVRGEREQGHNFRKGNNDPVEIIVDTDYVRLEGNINWSNDYPDVRPKSVVITAKNNNGDVVDTCDVNINPDENGYYVFKKLPRTDSEGNPINYSVEQSKAKGYTTICNRAYYNEQKRTWVSDITNTLTGRFAMNIEKKITGDAPENKEKYSF